MTENNNVNLMKRTVVYTHPREARKKWTACLVVMIAAGLMLYLGIENRKINFLILSIITLLFFGFHFWHNSRFLFKRKVFLILDNTGMYKQDGSLLVTWEEIENISYTREKTLDNLVVKTKKNETFTLHTYNVVPLDEISKVLRAYGVKIA